MKKTGARLAALALGLIMLAGLLTMPASAAPKKQTVNRSIAIVFDNSGSMYKASGPNQAWARATYAMEVFGSMLNEGDTLYIYPMHPIEVGNDTYSMDKPLRLTGSQNAETIRSIYTPAAGDTPIESIERAHEGLMREPAGNEKWLIILTDGNTFNRLGSNTAFSVTDTKEELEKLMLQYNGDMNVCYLGIGDIKHPPACEASGGNQMVIKVAKDSKDVLKELTGICNKIFGRDTLPASHIHGNTLDIDVSVGKLIVFIQGDQVSNVSLKGSGGAQTPAASTVTSAPEAKEVRLGSGAFKTETDASLQGVMLTYEGLKGDNYTLDYTCAGEGVVDVYYEPDVDMTFTFTESGGGEIDPEKVYEGDYTISFGMKDAQTGEFTESDLLGDINYRGHYEIDGQSYEINCSEMSGRVENIHLAEGSTFTADMHVTYLGGYQIDKSAEDFGWLPFIVKPRPAGELTLKITGGESNYKLTKLEEGEHFRVEVYYEGELLTDEKLAAVELKWPGTEGGELLAWNRVGDHGDLYVRYLDPADPQSTPTGTFTVDINAEYTPPATEPSSSNVVTVTFSIEDDRSPLGVKLTAEQDYYVIREMEEGKPVRADITLNGNKLTHEQFDALEFTVDCGGLDYELEPLPDESAYLIHLKRTEGVDEGSYKIKCSANLRDEIGRENPASGETSVTLSKIPRWMKILAVSLLALLLLLLILAILHIKALPTKLHANKRQCRMTVNSADVTANTRFNSKLDKKRVTVETNYAGKPIGVVMDVKPGKGSYVKTPHAKRVAEVLPKSVNKQGNAKVSDIMIGSIHYVFDDTTRKYERKPKSDKPFNLKNGTTVICRGEITLNGVKKKFSSSTKLDFKKKK